MRSTKVWKKKAIKYVTDHWGEYPNSEWDYSEGYHSYLKGVREFQKLAIKDLKGTLKNYGKAKNQLDEGYKIAYQEIINTLENLNHE